MNENKPIYIFISHSHKDLEKVRIVRNYLETLKGCETLLFFLLSLGDNDLITTLIKNEIEARMWFVYCDSENARKSDWVKSEIEYAKSIGKHNFIKINLDECVVDGKLTRECQYYLLDSYRKFVSLSKLFISYNQHDFPIIKEIITTLSRFNISMFDVEKLTKQANVGSDFSESIQQQIIDSDYVLTFFGKVSVHQQLENEIAYKLRKEVINIFLNDGANDFSLIENDPYLMTQNIFIFDVKNMESSCDKLIKYLFDMIH